MIGFFDDNKAQEGHGRQSARSGAVSMALRGANIVFQLGSVLILARLLSPEDYGLVGMVLAITGFATFLVDLGSRDAIARWDRVTQPEVAALFWITLGMGCALALVVAASAPLIASFYREPRLTNVAMVSSLVFITTALSCAHNALMRRAMMFQRLALIEVAAGISSGVLAIVMAATGWHYWSLVVRPIAMSLFIVAGVWMHCRWLPVKPAFTSGVKDMLKFGVALIGTSVTEFSRQNVDRVAIGWRYGAASLGQYQNALGVYGNVIDPFNSLHEVAVGGFSKVLDNPPEFRRLWTKAISTLTFFLMPAFGLLAVTSQDLIVLLLGQKWAVAGVILSVFALRGIPQVLERTLGWLHVSAGRADRWMRWSLIATAAQLVSLFIGLPYGLTGVALALVLNTYALILPAVAYAGRPIGIGARHVIEAAGKPFVGAVVSVSLGFALRPALVDISSLQRTALLSIVFTLCYLGIVVGILRMTEPLLVGWSLVRHMLPGRLFPPAEATLTGGSERGL